jgi:hypothetical protein
VAERAAAPRPNVRLTDEQAAQLALSVLEAYRSRTGADPLRIIHKTSRFSQAEQAGFQAAFRDSPIVEFVTPVPSAFRLLRFGPYPPQVGTVCTVNRDRTFLFASGFMPELGRPPSGRTVATRLSCFPIPSCTASASIRMRRGCRQPKNIDVEAGFRPAVAWGRNAFRPFMSFWRSHARSDRRASL